MRFLVDMPVTPKAVAHLKLRGHDAIHAMDVGLAEATDEEILAVARAEGRVVVTADHDYPRLPALESAAGPGVILFRGGSYSNAQMLDLLDRVLARLGAADLEHAVTVVDRTRMRSHSLRSE